MRIRQFIVNQFKRPRGLIGSLAGKIMASRPSNVARNEWTVDLLSLHARDRVLEIGFGPGLAIERAATRVTEGIVQGIDHSEVMLQQASRRNAEAITAARVQLFLGTLEDLPAYEMPFTKIFSANVVQFWSQPVREFRKLREMLAPNGVLVSTYMPRNKSASNADGRTKANEIQRQLREAGFTNVEIKELSLKPLSAYSVVAVND